MITLFEKFKSEQPLKVILSKIISGSIEPEEILNYLGDNDVLKKLKSKSGDYDDEMLSIDLNNDDVDDLLGLYRSTTTIIQNIDTYGYEYYVDDSEIDYIEYYLNDTQKQKLINFAKFVGYENTKYNAQFYPELIEDFNLESLKSNYVGELSNIKENAVKEKKTKEIDEPSPVVIDYRGIELSYEDAIKFIEDNELEVYTLSELFEHIGSILPYDEEFEYDITDYENFKDLTQTIDSAIDNIWNDDFKELQSDYIIKLIYSFDKNISILKKLFDLIEWNSKERFYMKGYKYYFEMYYNDSDIHKWIVSSDFNKRLNKYIENIDEDDEMIQTYKEMRKKKQVKRFKL